MPKQQDLHDLIRHSLKLNPKIPNRTLARAISQQTNGIYTVEQVRGGVRYIRGRMGEKKRKCASDKSMFIPLEKKLWNPYDVPKAAKTKEDFIFKPYDLPAKNNGVALANGLLLADFHFPYHENDAINTALEFGDKRKINFIIIDGDLLDFYQLSRFQKNPLKRNASDEIEMVKEFFTSLRKHFPKALIIYKYGNHEDRWEKWWWQHAREMGDVFSRSLNKELELEKFGIVSVSSTDIIRHKELNIAHGHELVRGMGNQVSPSRTAYLRAKEIVAVAHFHRESTNSVMTMGGKLVTTWSIGCLCDLHPDWMPFNDWCHGFALLQVGDDPWRFENHRIYKGKVL